MSEFNCFAMSEPGANHEINEDFLAIEPGLGVFVIADGMGGRPGGAHASQLAVKAFLEQIRSLDNAALLDEMHLREAFDAANRKIRAFVEKNQQNAGMGTTMTAVVMDGKRGKIVHVGDTRLYLFRESRLFQVTRDHTLVSELMERNLLNAEEAEHYPLRHVLSMVLGPQEKVEPDIDNLEIGIDEWLVMATDGLSRAISKEDLTKVIKQYRTKDAKTLCRAIMSAATWNELQDYVNVAVVRILGEKEDG